MSSIPLVRIWIWISALATVAGWILSAVGQLNRVGYSVFFGVAAVVFFLGKKQFGWSAGTICPDFKKFRRRFRRAWPLSFAILSGLIFIGAVLYPPSNHAALSYRTARVLHWLAEGRWHWIHTPVFRMNVRACGIEWLCAPLILLTNTDRFIPLLNFFPFLLLPGLIFSICTRLGINGRVAWNWMWILPSGYCFLLQAGSAGNDTFPTVYALAAIDFACRAWSSRRLSDLWMSGLAIALLGGAKASNLPLMLPWALLILPLLPLAKHCPVATAVMVGLAAVVSFLPTAILNIVYCHDWSGLSLENKGMDMKNPIVGIWGNVFLFLLSNFTPPIFPMAGWWNQNALSILPKAIVGSMVANFEGGFHILGELPTEDATGIGFGVSVLVAVSLVGSVVYHFKSQQPTQRDFVPMNGRSIPLLVRQCALVAPWLALVAYCMKSGMVTGARLIAPYYPLLLPLMLVLPGTNRIVQTALWRWLVWINLLLAAIVLTLTPGRPLWPAETILSKLHEEHPQKRTIKRALDVYQVYATRWDPVPKVRDFLPNSEKVVGYLGTKDDIDISLWRPFGRRQVKHILLTDSIEETRREQIHYVVIAGLHLKAEGVALESWLERMHGKLVGTLTATVKLAEGPQDWYVVHLSE